MSTGLSSWRQRRTAARMRREMGRALDTASTPAMHQELLALAGSRPWTNITH